MATFRPGQVIRFTYRHFWPRDANSRDSHKEIFVLHTHWENKVHGIDLKVLSAAQIETLRAIMDPRNNRPQDKGFDVGVGQDFIEKVRHGDQGKAQLQQLEMQLKNLDSNMKRMQALAATRVNPDGSRMKISIDTMQRYTLEKQRLKKMIDEFDINAATPDQNEQRDVAMKALTPMARQILQRVKPARLVNNPRIFYNVVVKPLIGRVDAYRTFYPGRMIAVQVDPRWNWVQGAGSMQAPPQGVPKQQPKTPIVPLKMKGAERPETPEEIERRSAFMGKFQPTRPQAPARSGVGPSVMKGGTTGVIRASRPPVIIKKPERPK